MKLATAKLTKLVIADAPNLDPIHVYAEDMGHGRGSLLVRCYDRAWYAYWGAMGREKDGSTTTVQKFVLSCDTGYLTDNLVCGNRARITSSIQQAHDERYVGRIVDAIKRAFQQLQPVVTPARAGRIARMAHANDLIQVISRHGRKFFRSSDGHRVARIEMDARGKLWWIDDYRGARICMERFARYEHEWRGFSHGGTLKQLAQMMRDYIKTSERIPLGYICQPRMEHGDIWGYGAAAEACRAEAAQLPIILKL